MARLRSFLSVTSAIYDNKNLIDLSYVSLTIAKDSCTLPTNSLDWWNQMYMNGFDCLIDILLLNKATGVNTFAQSTDNAWQNKQIELSRVDPEPSWKKVPDHCHQ